MSGNIFRNYAAALTSPTAWIGLFLILGVILLWTKKQKMAKWFLTIGTFAFVLFAFDPLTEILLNNYENEYPAFKTENLVPGLKIKYVVVLAGGYVPNPPLHPLTTELTKHTLLSLIEGIKIHREIPDSLLVFTGKGWAAQSEAKAMKELAMKLGLTVQLLLVLHLAKRDENDHRNAARVYRNIISTVDRRFERLIAFQQSELSLS